MSGQRVRSGDRPTRRRTGPWSRRGAVVALCLFAICLSLAGPVAAEDTDPPSFGNTTVVDERTFELVVEDDEGVDEDSIERDDFSIDPGNIDDVNVSERGNDSVVTVELAGAVNTDNATLSLASGETIADDAGNELTDDSAKVVGIDGVGPILEDFDVTWVGDSTATIGITITEPMGDVTVDIDGRESHVLGPEDFEAVETRAASEYRYETNHTFVAEDEYRVTLQSIEDEWDNRIRYHRDRTALHDVTPPNASVDGPTTTTVDHAVTYDGFDSTDELGIDDWEWTVDGTVVGNGSTLDHTFEEPGRHEVGLTVTDGRNSTDRRYYPVEVLDSTTTEDVSITPTNGTGVDVVVGPNRSKERVLVERDGGLAGSGNVVLDSLTLSVPTGSATNLSTAASSGGPTMFEVGDPTAIETFEFDHEGANVTNVTFRFSIARSTLDDANHSVDDVALYRDGDDWERLSTYRVGGNDTHVQYRATSPGLSRFVVGATDGSTENATESVGEGGDGEVGNADDEDGGGSDDGEDGGGSDDGEDDGPEFAVVDGRVLTPNVTAGEPVVARATVENDGNSTGTYVAGLRVNESLLNTTEVTIPAGEHREITVAEPIDAGGSVTLNETALGTVTVDGTPAQPESADGGGGFPLPDPMALWPGGLFGRVLGAIFWLVLIVYGILKGLAIHFGY